MKVRFVDYLLTSGELGRLRHFRELFPPFADEDDALPIFFGLMLIIDN